MLQLPGTDHVTLWSLSATRLSICAVKCLASRTSNGRMTPTYNSATSKAAIVATRAECASRGAGRAFAMARITYLYTSKLSEDDGRRVPRFARGAGHYCHSLPSQERAHSTGGVIFSQDDVIKRIRARNGPGLAPTGTTPHYAFH